MNGVASLVAHLLFETFMIRSMQSIYEVFADYVSNWRWPAGVQDCMFSETFTELRARKHRAAMRIKGQASDPLFIRMGVLFTFHETVLMRAAGEDTECRNACQAFMAFAAVRQLVSEAARSSIEPAELLGKTHGFLELFVAAWGSEWLMPKCHWVLRCPEILEKLGRLFNCFCLGSIACQVVMLKVSQTCPKTHPRVHFRKSRATSWPSRKRGAFGFHVELTYCESLGSLTKVRRSTSLMRVASTAARPS